MQHQVMHATLSKNGQLLLMGSDMTAPGGWTQGNNMALSYRCDREEEIFQLFNSLSAGGAIIEGVKQQFWGDLFGVFTDRFGIRWMLNAPKAAEPNGRERLHFSVPISAPKEKIWDVLLQDDTFRIWTIPFCEGSYAESDWQEGGKVHFKTPAGEGMVSRIVTHRPGEVISFEHLGILKDGKEVYDHPEATQWKGAEETYSLKKNGNGYTLEISQDITPEYKDFMQKAWSEALQKLKQLAEAAPVEPL